MTISAGVASIKGTYQGDVSLTDQQQPGSFVLRASGAGAPGTVSADVKVSLAEHNGVTRLDYDADAVVGGMIGGVGQRVLSGVAKKTRAEFFRAVEDVLTGKAPAPAPLAASGGRRAGVFTAPVPTGPAVEPRGLHQGSAFRGGVASPESWWAASSRDARRAGLSGHARIGLIRQTGGRAALLAIRF